MIGHYVHVEVREMSRGILNAVAEADCVISLPTGESVLVAARLHSDRAPFWRVSNIEDFGNPLIAKAIDLIGEEALLSRISTAASLWNVWDSIRAQDRE